MTEDDEAPEYGCVQCGLIFGLSEIEDFDDVKCPDCGSGNVIGESEFGG